MNKIFKIYNKLYSTYGPQGWWPLLDHKGINPTKTGSINGYHINDYSFPKNENQKFEICLGPILTQNTNWINVEKALIKLNNKKLNFIHVPKGIKYSDVSKKTKRKFPCFSKIRDDLENCPIHTQNNIKRNTIEKIKDHLDECVYTKSKQQRIFGTIPDLIIFDDNIYYNKNG